MKRKCRACGKSGHNVQTCGSAAGKKYRNDRATKWKVNASLHKLREQLREVEDMRREKDGSGFVQCDYAGKRFSMRKADADLWLDTDRRIEQMERERQATEDVIQRFESRRVVKTTYERGNN